MTTEAHDETADAAETCVVCLQPITERAIIYPCNHLSFDFLCLASWLEHRQTCPLCNTSVQRVEYDWRSPDDYKVFIPPPKVEAEGQLARPQPGNQARTARYRGGRHQIQARTRIQSIPAPRPSADAALARRRLIYDRNAYSLHRSCNTPVTATAIRASAALQRKARLFLRRELHLFTYLTTSNRIEFVLEYILGMLRRMDIKGADGSMENLVAEILGRRTARLLLHELEAWLNSSFDRLEDFDRYMQYADPEVIRFARHWQHEEDKRRT